MECDSYDNPTIVNCRMILMSCSIKVPLEEVSLSTNRVFVALITFEIFPTRPNGPSSRQNVFVHVAFHIPGLKMRSKREKAAQGAFKF